MKPNIDINKLCERCYNYHAIRYKKICLKCQLERDFGGPSRIEREAMEPASGYSYQLRRKYD